MIVSYIVKFDDCYKNINEILANEFHFSTRLTSKLVRNNLVLKNGSPIDTRLRC